MDKPGEADVMSEVSRLESKYNQRPSPNGIVSSPPLVAVGKDVWAQNSFG